MTKSITMPNADIIVLTGGSASDPITATDLYDASVAGGWDAVEKSGENSFLIKKHIAFGSDSALGLGSGTLACYFSSADENIQLGTPDERKSYRLVQSASVLRFGDTDANGYGINGTSFINFSDYNSHRSVFGQTSGSLLHKGLFEWFGSKIYHDMVVGGTVEWMMGGKIDIRDCVIKCPKGMYFYQGNPGNVKRTSFDALALTVYSSGIGLQDLKLIGSTRQVYTIRSLLVDGVEFGDVEFHINRWGSPTLLDCTIKPEKITIGSDGISVYQKKRYSLLVKDANDAVLTGVRYRLSTNADNTIDLSGVSAASPTATPVLMDTHTRAEGVKSIVDASVKTLRVRRFGLKLYESPVTVTSKTDAVVKLEVDGVLTETNESVVSTYTTLDTAQHRYDYSRYWLATDAGMVYADFITLEGDALNCGDKNVVVDDEAAEVWAYNGTTLTIKSGVSDNIKTTGTITLEDGVEANGVLLDANGDSALVFSGIDTWILYGTDAQRDSNISAVASGTGSYRFNFASGTTYYARLQVGSTTILQDITPTQAGVTEVSLSTAGQLVALTDIAQITQSHARAANLQTQRIA